MNGEKRDRSSWKKQDENENLDNRTLDLSTLLIPTNEEAEKDLLSGLIADSTAMAVVFPIVLPKDFADEGCREVYTLMRGLYNKNKRWTVATLYSKPLSDLAKSRLYHVSETNTSRYLKELAEEVRNKGVGRRIFKELYVLMKANAESSDHSALLSQALQKFVKLSQRTTGDETSKLKVIQEHRDLMKARYGGEVVTIPTGFPDLDEYLGQGMRKSNLLIVGARPSVGKTSFSLSVAHNAALSGKKVMFFTLEMSVDEIMDRLVAFQSGLSANDVIRGLAPKEKIVKAYKELLKLPLVVADVPEATTSAIYSMALREQAKNGLDLVVVDYLAKLRDPFEKGMNMNNWIGRLMSNLKFMAKMLDIAVLTPHQLNREIEKGSKERAESPKFSDLRDSGTIEADADVVMFLTRKSILSHDLRLHLSKQRTGPTGEVELDFDLSTTKIHQK